MEVKEDGLNEFLVEMERIIIPDNFMPVILYCGNIVVNRFIALGSWFNIVQGNFRNDGIVMRIEPVIILATKNLQKTFRIV